MQRPPPEWIKARKWEIRRRYRRKVKVGRRSRSMAAIRISELTRWLGQVGRQLNPSQRSETIARIFVHHFVVLPDGNRRAADWLVAFCPWIETRDRENMITEANHCPLKWTADKLAWKIGLTDQMRTELKIKTIGAVDFNRDQRQARRRKAEAARQRARRANLKAVRNI